MKRELDLDCLPLVILLIFIFLCVISSRESHASLKVDQQYVYASSWAFDSSVLKIFILWIFVKKKKKGKERRREEKE